jgi:HAD superfamily hydrolase (TIGR01509 family)
MSAADQAPGSLAILFDWDGVIVDSSAAHELSWEQLAAEERRPLPPGHFKAGFGKRNEIIIPEILGWTHDLDEVRRLSLRKEALYRAIIRARGIAPLPGAVELLAALAAAHVPTCIGSSTHRENIETILDVIGLRARFVGMVTAEDVTRGKPDPEVFLRAAAKCGVSPARCVVFEDAFSGLAAALAGGMKRVAVATTHPDAQLAPHADRVIHRLDELDVPALRDLVTV